MSRVGIRGYTLIITPGATLLDLAQAMQRKNISQKKICEKCRPHHKIKISKGQEETTQSLSKFLSKHPKILAMLLKEFPRTQEEKKEREHELKERQVLGSLLITADP